ncbi:hypothetical protein HDV03_001128 [Kappamyces sp. JEL0829]|nr:hypothetical protein HDV03_001128 [Kappamyces sp. JEL0829]
MDHVCWRVETEDEYHSCFKFLESINAALLVEDLIGGRLIATFKLAKPVQAGKKTVQLVELPMPKKGVPYKSGWEHAEFVVGPDQDLLKFTQQYPDLVWDLDGLKKDFNSDVRIELGSDFCVKFHHLSLEKVIAIEKEEKARKQ